MTVGTPIDPGWKWDDEYPLAQGIAIEIGKLLFISGQIAMDPNGDLVGEGDVREQTRQIFKNLEEILRKKNCKLNNIVRITAYLTDAALFKKYDEVRKEVLQDNRPTSTTVVVSGLVLKGLLVEVDAIAVIERRGEHKQ